MSSLSIGMVCFPSLGGSGVVAADLAVGLAHRGHRVHFISRAQPTRPLPNCDRLTFHPVDLPDYPLFEHPPYTVGLASAMVDLARAHRLDILHVHYAVPHAASAYLARAALAPHGPKVITSLHGTDVLRVGSHPAYRSMTRFTVAQSDGIIVPSEYLKREAHRLLDLPASVPIEIIPNFVDTDRFSPPPSRREVSSDGPRLIHVSNFRPVKRVIDVIEVLAQVRETLPARLTLVGDGPDRAAVESRVEALGLGAFVTFLGRRNDFVEELRAADAFILPSELESFGVAALEALSTGVPVFGYRVGGLPDLVTEEVGRLVSPFDVPALSSAVIDVLQNPDRHLAMREAARARAVTHYRAEPALNRYETWLREKR